MGFAPTETIGSVLAHINPAAFDARPHNLAIVPFESFRFHAAQRGWRVAPRDGVVFAAARQPLAIVVGSEE